MYPGTDTLSEWPRRWTRNPLGSARKGSNPLGVPLLARYVAGVWLPLPWPLLTRLKSIEVITGARGASHVVPRIPVEERRALRGKPERTHCLWPTSSKGACSFAATYKPPILVPRARPPAGALLA